MRVVTWNVNGATEKSEAWNILTDLKPDIALLQEVSVIPERIADKYDVKFHITIGKSGKPQRCGNVVLVKGKIIDELLLSSQYFWVNHEIEHFRGNLLSCVVQISEYSKLNIISAYSPTWPVDISNYPGVDVTPVKLKTNPNVWVTEILWSALKNADLTESLWIIGGDLNSSMMFDPTFGSGNREIQERMNALGLTECLRTHHGKPVPTFRNLKDGKVIHQMDHLFVTNPLRLALSKCNVFDEFLVFGKNISNHLPIIADFRGNPSLTTT